MIDVEKELQMCKMSLCVNSEDLAKKLRDLVRRVAAERDRAVELWADTGIGFSKPLDAKRWVISQLEGKP